MQPLRLLLFLSMLLLLGTSCSRYGATAGNSGLQASHGVLNGEDYKNLILAPVVIDGKECHLLVDTGASHTLLRRDVVKKMWPDKKLHYLGGDTVSNIEGPLFYTMIGNMSCDSFEAKNLAAIVADLSHLGNAGKNPVAGMLGMDILGTLPILIDVSASRITFFDKVPPEREFEKAGAIRVPIRRDGNHVRAKLVMDGIPMNFIIDTGATLSCMDRRSWKRKTSKSPNNIQWVDVNGISRLKQYDYGTVKKMKWGDISFPDVVVFFEANEKIMGGDILKKGKLFLDRRTNRAWWFPR